MRTQGADKGVTHQKVSSEPSCIQAESTVYSSTQGGIKQSSVFGQKNNIRRLHHSFDSQAAVTTNSCVVTPRGGKP